MVDADRCNGCCLCQLACPVDCIRMIEDPRAWTEDLAQRSRSNYLRGKARKEERSRLEEERLNSKSQKDKKDFLAALLKRKRNK
ncbi:4Fe-4S binding protein [uncultured Parasutterella sp.]|nr:4Fe-4S binding protein [uncultured Parasutterella sp.]